MFSKYYDFFDMFFYTKIDKFSSHYFNNYKILLMLDKKSSFDLIYNIFQNEFKILKKYFDNNLIKKFTRLNFFLIVSLVFFTRKFNEKFHFYINYRALNVIIIKNQYSLFLIQKTLSRICRIKIYIILNIIIAFNKL